MTQEERTDVQTYRLTIEYDGAKYSGWQEQKNARTVQGILRKAITVVAGEGDLGGAGRTDAGVHALAQVAHLRLHRPLEMATFLSRINGMLPQDIHVLRIDKVPHRFHARHDAVARFYLYQVALRRTAFHKRYVWWVKDPIDVDLVRKRLEELHGLHDFGAFADKRRDEEESGKALLHDCCAVREGDMLLLRIGGSHFLWRMVRRIVGVLVAVGTGRLADAPLVEVARRVDVPSLTAPASGLFLEYVRYPGDPPPGPVRAVTPL